MGMFDQQPGMFTDPLGGGGQSGLGGLAGILGEYLRNVMSGQIAANGALGQNHYDPSATLAQNALNPQALANATDIAMGVSGGGLGIRAYHASPYDFDRFDISKIGTGQGAQAYGHGIYAAESPAVSGKGGQYDLEFTAKNLGKSDLNQGEANILRMLRSEHTDMDIVGELARGGYSFDEALTALNRVKDAKAKIYEVDIHADPNAFLNYDKALSEQPHVQAAFDKLGVAPGPRWELLPKTPLMTGAPKLAPEEASAALQAQGIPGIKYLDQGSRGVGDGTSNYVVFDPSIIEILRKYGILGPVAAPGALMPFMGDQQQ